MIADIINATTGQPTDMTAWPTILDKSNLTMSEVVNFARESSPLLADVDIRAEHRVWGSYPHTMAAMTGRELPGKRALVSGVLNEGGYWMSRSQRYGLPTPA